MKKIIRQIHAAAPIRICDVGGWTDTWFAGHGAVFNIAVRPLVEVQITISPDSGEKERITLHLENYHETYSLAPGNIHYNKHPLIEAAVGDIELPHGIAIEIDIFSEAPPGAAVGTSAALTVALIGALDAVTGVNRRPREIAAAAYAIETGKLGLQSGVQDQLSSALGGVNFIDVYAFPDAHVLPVTLPPAARWDLEKRLSLVYIGAPHSSSEVHKKVIADLGENAGADPRIDGLRKLAAAAKEAARQADFKTLGAVMTQSIALQRALHPHLVGEKFDEIIDIANFYDAQGCKVNGAGGDGGSLTILGDGDVKKKREMLCALKEKGYLSIPIALSPDGLRVFQSH